MEEAVVKRVMPHSNEAEQAVIGSMLMDADAITTAMEKISEDDFYNKQYCSLFKAMIELYNEGKISKEMALSRCSDYDYVDKSLGRYT